MSTVEVGTAKLTLTGDTTGLEVAIDRAKQKQMGLGQVAEAEAAKMTSAQRKVIQSLDQQITKLGLTREQHLQLKVIMQTEGNVRDALLAKIKANTAAVEKETRVYEKGVNAVNQYGLTQKQQVAALRQVPAQLTDIVVSLQGGQNPLTVLLQQGGQLRDVFGGAVPALRALGGQVMALVNPFTLAAAALGVLLFAYKQFESQGDAFNRSLILTGQQSKLSADDLRGMATEMDNFSGVTQNQASQALALAAGTGKIAVEQLMLVTRAAVEMQNATGKAMEETISEYADFARDPVSAVLRLNESEHFLTQTLFDRIAAMQEAGDVEGAAAVASEARAAAQIQRAAEVRESLGPISGEWHDIKRGAAEAWDSAGSYFTNLDREAKEATNTLRNMWASFRIGGVGGMFGMQAALSGKNVAGSGTSSPSSDSGPTSQELAALKAIREGNRTREQRQKLEEQQIINIKKLTAAQIDSDADIVASRKAYEASLPKSRKQGDSGARSLANAEASLELERIKNDEEAQRNAITNSTKLLQAEYSARIVTAEAYYAKQRELLQQDSQAQQDSILKQIAFLKDRNVSGKDSVTVNKQIIELEAKLAKVRADTATQSAILGIQEKDLADKRREAMEDYQYNLDRNVEAINKSVDAQIAAIVYGEREAEKQQKLTDIYEKQTEALRKLLIQKERGDISPEEYDQRVNAENQAAQRAANAVVEGYRRMDEAQADWLNGLRSGVQDWIQQTSNVASQINALTIRALDGTVDALTNLFTTGKSGFKELLADLGKELARFFAKRAVMQLLQSFGGGGGGMGGGFFKDGAAFTNPTPSLSALSGQVINKPTAFMFARGAALGVGGEAGPEAIMPLERGPNGKLGVTMYGGGAGQAINVQIVTNIENSETETEQSGQQDSNVKMFAESMKTMVVQGIQKSMLPGGDLYNAGVRGT